jgi:ammonia channel protein AmtB
VRGHARCPFSRAGPTHFAGGAVGLVSVACFARRSYLRDIGYVDLSDEGLFFGGNGHLLLAQLVALGVLAAWAGAGAAAVFLVLKAFNRLRLPLENEVLGIDARFFEKTQRKGDTAMVVLQRAVSAWSA